ncbi:agrin-like isoform X2 [Amphiura filiformis]|uniref:agrin-like isoform X2 n=1 Tax=Amphiura filiformis TaxID=82378 RepID=UPI003B224D7F
MRRAEVSAFNLRQYPICEEILDDGCSWQLKRTGRVCGTDGITYRNACVLQKRACKVQYNLELFEYSPCGQQEGGIGGEETEENAQMNPWYPIQAIIDTSSSSSEEEDVADPGVEGGTVTDGGAGTGGDAGYTNAPEGPAAATVGGITVDIMTTMATVVATTLEPFVGAGPEAKLDKCMQKCPLAKSYDTVCGSDGRQYQSGCHLEQYACLTNETVTVVHRGSCNNTCGPECPRVYEPVCGTDGMTYDFSRCDLERTSCLLQDDTLQVAYNGECIRSGPLKGCPKCDPIAAPVCSSINVTFRSQCEFNRFICINDIADVGIAFNDSCANAPLLCPNYCERIEDPVCGSNGVTYPNVCELGLADCHARTSDPAAARIMFSSFGYCPEGTIDPCSRDSPNCDLTEAPVCAMVDKEMVSFYNR